MTRRLVDERGTTLTEVVVSAAVGVVVLLAILGALDVFRSTTEATARAPISQETARATLRTLVDDLRPARVPAGEVTPVDHTSTSTGTDLIVAVWLPTPGGASQPGWLRYCVTESGRSLVVGQRHVAAWPGAPPTCAPTATSDAAAGWVQRMIVDGDLVPGSRPFAFTSDACFGTTGTCPPPPTAVRAVTIRLRLDARGAGGVGRTIDQTGTVGLRNVP